MVILAMVGVDHMSEKFIILSRTGFFAFINFAPVNIVYNLLKIELSPCGSEG